MISSNVIQAGDKIELRIVSKCANSNEKEVYLSQFLKWEDENNIVMIALPLHQGQLIALQENLTYELRFFTKGGLYCCKATILKRRKHFSSIPAAVLKLTSPLKKLQRRQFFRMGCLFSMKYSVLTEEQRIFYMDRKRYILDNESILLEEKLMHKDIDLKKGVVLDISGGGIRFISREVQNEGDILLLCMELPEELLNKIPFMVGRVVVSKQILGQVPDTFDSRVEFIDISKEEQEQLVTYIFKEEREKRKKNLQ